MIGIKVRDYRGCERADIVCAPIALVAGRNAMGKTSVAQATAATLTGLTLPIAGMTKRDAGALVRVGCGAASVEIRSEAGSARVAWPACQASADGDPPRASAYAAGRDSLVDETPEDRARSLAQLLHTDPTREDFAAAMADKGLGAEQIVGPMWKLVADKGWDGAHQLRRDKGAELKGRWRQVAGTHYGSRIAAGWTPPGWTDDLDGQTERELEAALADAKSAHRRAIAADATSQARREALDAEAGKLDERLRLVEEAAREQAAAEADVAALRQQRDALPPAHGATGMPCPHCGGRVVIVQRNLAEQTLEKAPQPVPEAELRQRRAARAEADGTLSNAEARASEAKRKLSAAQTSLEISRNATAELAKLPPPAPAGEAIGDAGAAVTRAEQRLAALRAKCQADDIHNRIASNELVLEILAADGLRARKLAKVLELFNSGQLAPLCQAAGWKSVEITADMAITYGGRPYPLLSASEQYRVRAVLQVATARLDGSSMVVIDAADILDAPTRSGLFGMLLSAEIPALVAMTLSKREQAPDLAAAGLGRSYWLSSGIAEPIGQTAVWEAA
jgi:hypothetical protein